MLIGIEAERANLPQKTGVEHYAKQLILHLAKIDKQNRYRLYLRTKPEKWFLELPKNFEIRLIPFPVFWTQLRLSLEMLVSPPDVLLIPASAMPFVHPKASFATIHDLAWKYYPQTFTWFMRNFLNWSTGFAVRNSKKIIAVSEATKRDLLKYYGAAENKIAVVYHGFESPDPQAQTHIDGGLTLPKKYILFLSTLQPRKNLNGLIDAFLCLKKEHPELPHKLVVIGKPGWKAGPILNRISQAGCDVIYLNHVSDEFRIRALSSADLMVLPSYYEGFGMTILESFAAGTPVATSNVSSMPEIAGQAAVFFNPNDTADIKHAIYKVISDQNFALDLKQKGKQRLLNFSWDKCAKETLRIITEGKHE